MLIHRRITTSFKDYFGMSDLKRIALEMAENRFVGSASLGLLLCGDIRTGKSFFGKVLANELGIPLQTLLGSKLKEAEDGELFYFEDEGTQYPLKQYFERIKKAGYCVLLIDEVEDVPKIGKPPVHSQLLRNLQELAGSKLPVVVIATTNRPKFTRVGGMEIKDDGSSSEMDQVLSEHIHSDLFRVLRPCYFFHERSTGYYFARDYLRHLMNMGKIETSVDLERISSLAKGLASANIITALSSVSENPLRQSTIIEKIKVLKQEVDETIDSRENLIKTKVEDLVSNGTPVLEGQIDYTELAIIAEDLPQEVIVEILRNAPSTLTQDTLLDLFSNYHKNKMRLALKTAWNTLGRNPDLPYDAITNFLYKQVEDFYCQAQAFSIGDFTAQLKKLHEAFISNGIWGKDTKRHSRTFEALSEDMKLNYLVIFLAASIAFIKDGSSTHTKDKVIFEKSIKELLTGNLVTQLNITPNYEWSLISNWLLKEINSN